LGSRLGSRLRSRLGSWLRSWLRSRLFRGGRSNSGGDRLSGLRSSSGRSGLRVRDLGLRLLRGLDRLGLLRSRCRGRGRLSDRWSGSRRLWSRVDGSGHVNGGPDNSGDRFPHHDFVTFVEIDRGGRADGGEKSASEHKGLEDGSHCEYDIEIE
jgi:hypothetical protein